MSIDGEFVVIDFETTGLSPAKGDRITEVAAVRVRGTRITDRFVTLVNCGVPIPFYIQTLTGISDEMRNTASDAAYVIPQLMDFIGNSTLCAHNAAFDHAFLENECRIAGLRLRKKHASYICTRRLAQRYLPSLGNYKLPTLESHLGLIRQGRAHRAESDALVTCDLIALLAEQASRAYGQRTIPVQALARLTETKLSHVPAWEALTDGIRRKARAQSAVLRRAKRDAVGAAADPPAEGNPGPIVPEMDKVRAQIQSGQANEGANSSRPASSLNGRASDERAVEHAQGGRSGATAVCNCRSCSRHFVVIDDSGRFVARCPVCGSQDTKIIAPIAAFMSADGNVADPDSALLRSSPANKHDQEHSVPDTRQGATLQRASSKEGAVVPHTALRLLPWTMNSRTRVLRHSASGVSYTPDDYKEVLRPIHGFETRALSARHAFIRRIDVQFVGDANAPPAQVSNIAPDGLGGRNQRNGPCWHYSRRTGMLVDKVRGVAYTPDQYEEVDGPALGFKLKTGSTISFVRWFDVKFDD